ncbi:metalloprotease [Entomophthora muscae]|uniref:Metalloprotease n=1 Tax=Entomophthora muscae TaxID=34485 RepID=A0ACC2RH51_9FUNG|nr:metalloprotease [Entomophthora muscae]
MFKISLLPVLLVLGKHLTEQSLNGIPYYPSEAHIQKNPLDRRDYQGLLLNNGIKVLLISDPKATKAVLSLAVATGSLDDPDDVPGLAHFTEHLILQGSKKYPGPFIFQEFLDANNGQRNAYTGPASTVYHFSIDRYALETAMDMFVELFVEPEFNATTVSKEVKAVDYEYQMHKKLSKATFRHTAFAALNSTHKATRFACGNYETLATKPASQGVNIRDLVVSHYLKYYSSNTMDLVIIGKEDIETLKEMVIPRFSKIPNRNLTPEHRGSPFNSTTMPMEVFIDSKSNLRESILRFVLAPTSFSYSNSYLKYVKHFFESREEGSFMYILETKYPNVFGYLDVYEAQNVFTILDFYFIAFKGDFDKNEITKLLFAYLNAIKTQGITPERYAAFIETSRTTSPEYSFSTRYTDKLVTRLQFGADFSNLLDYYSSETPAFDKQLLTLAISSLNTSNFILYDVKSFTGLSKTEPWYGFDYSSSRLDSAFLQRLDTIAAAEYEIKLPKIKPSELEVVSEVTFKSISLLANNSVGYVETFTAAAKAKRYFELEFYLGNSRSPNLLAYRDLLKEALETLLSRALQEDPSQKASFWFETLDRSISLILEEEEGKVFSIVSSLAHALKSHASSNEMYESSKSQYLKSVEDSDFKYFFNPTIRWMAMMDPFFRNDQQRAVAVNGTTFQGYALFLDGLRSSLRFNIVSSSHYSGSFLTELKAHVEMIFSLDPSSTPYLPMTVPRFSLRGDFVYIEKELEENSFVLYYLHMYDSGAVQDLALAKVVGDLIQSPFFFQLRSNEQLGYIAQAGFAQETSGGGIVAEIQSDQPAIYLESRIEAFMQKFVDEIRNISEQKLQDTISNLINVQEITVSKGQPKDVKKLSRIERAAATKEEGKMTFIQI